MKGIKMLSIVSMMICAATFLCLPVLVFAEGNGVVGTEIVNMLSELLKNNTLAIAIYTAIMGLIGIGFRILLKKLPTGMQTIAGVLFWKIAAALFGDGVVLEKNNDMAYVKRQLLKKYPLLRIEVKEH